MTIAALGAIVSAVSGSTIWELCRRADDERERARLVIPLKVGRFRVLGIELASSIARVARYGTHAVDAHGVDGRARERDHDTS